MKQDQDELLTRLLDKYQAAEEATDLPRRLSQRDRDWYDGKQLTELQQAELARRGQPAIVINRIKRKIDFLAGVERRSRTDPKAFPRNPGDAEAAHAATDALRYVADANDFAETASQVWEEMLVEGHGGVEILPEGADIKIRHVPWDRLFHDPFCRRKDFADAQYAGLVLWLDMAEAKARWPGKGQVLEAVMNIGGLGQSFDDRPRGGVFGDQARQRVKVVQMHWRDATKGWMSAVFTRSGFLEEPAESACVDEDGDSVCPLILVSAFVDRDNARYGAAREMIGPQSEINQRRSRALHLLSVRQVMADEGAVQDQDKARRELSKADGFIEVAPGLRFEVLRNGDMAEAQFRLLQEAKAEIDQIGPSQALLGKPLPVFPQSGRAIEAQQAGGAVELEPLIGAHRDWKKRVFRAVWALVRQHWTQERWIRVTDSLEGARFVAVNRKVTLADRLNQMEPEEAAAMAAALKLKPQDKRLEQSAGIVNKLAELDLDIVLDEGPDAVVLQGEQFKELANLAAAGVPIPPDVLIAASSLRNKDKLIERLQAAPDAESKPDPNKGEQQ